MNQQTMLLALLAVGAWLFFRNRGVAQQDVHGLVGPPPPIGEPEYAEPGPFVLPFMRQGITDPALQVYLAEAADETPMAGTAAGDAIGQDMYGLENPALRRYLL